MEEDEHVRGSHRMIADIPYLAADIDRLLIRYTDREMDAATLDVHRVPIHDGRTQRGLSLDREGFLLALDPSDIVRCRRDELIEENARPRDDDPPLVNRDYADAMVPMLKTLTGARDVLPDYSMVTVRFSRNSARKSWMGTAAFAHMDFARSQIDGLVAKVVSASGQEIAPYRRHTIVQTWRVITDPPQDYPLALCDGRSASIDEMAIMEFHGPPGSKNEYSEARLAHFRDRHAWYYFPDMVPDEVLIFKGFDSDRPDAMNAMHTAFENQDANDAQPRGSVECRFIALYD